ncbi:O-antigen polysaccharide polymerase Wzy [Micromonospora sp. NPDC049891]|uniref:O-antigen polysaccharide polymerase Wzy n=1 Tax=Micromonospora sp. NPDC049891 TaxID=3155655 RepID=UPI0033F4D032
MRIDINGSTFVWLTIVGAFAVPAVLIVKSGRRDILPYLAAYFAFFGFGPIVNFALGNSIYSGAVRSEIGMAAVGGLLALSGMLVVGLWVRVRRTALDRSKISGEGRRYHLLPFMFLGLAGYTTIAILQYGLLGFSGDKIQRIQQSGPWHYQLLLVQMLCCSFYFAAVATRFGKVSYWANFSCYVAYCLLTNERDFIFVVFSILLHVQLFRPRPMSARMIAAGAAAIVGAVFLASYRDRPLSSEGGAISQALNEGSTIFPDTFIMAAVPGTIPFAHGETYLRSAIMLLPGVPSDSLSAWLVEQYSADSASGYGFSLVAEAYLNFGMVGIPIVFALLALLQRYLVRRVDRGHFFAYASIVLTITWMYNFRGESLAVLKTAMYALLLYGVVHLFSTPMSTVARRVAPSAELPRSRDRSSDAETSRLGSGSGH